MLHFASFGAFCAVFRGAKTPMQSPGGLMWNGKDKPYHHYPCRQTVPRKSVWWQTTGYQPKQLYEYSELRDFAAVATPATTHGRRVHHRRSPTAMQRRLENKQERFSARQVVHEEPHSQDKAEELMKAILNLKNEVNGVLDLANKNLKASQESLCTMQNSLDDCFKMPGATEAPSAADAAPGRAVVANAPGQAVVAGATAPPDAFGQPEGVAAVASQTDGCGERSAEAREDARNRRQLTVRRPGGAIYFEIGSGAENEEQREVALDAGCAAVAAPALDPNHKPLFENRPLPGPGWVRVRDAFHFREPIAGDSVVIFSPDPCADERTGTLVQRNTSSWMKDCDDGCMGDVLVADGAQDWWGKETGWHEKEFVILFHPESAPRYASECAALVESAGQGQFLLPQE
ncbi:unnamed protein product [Prorocentrum cordatum]|uniref:Uncharacterized protein n=1 Tax=Prorocentrum cordatum TaxID=2364126 RepID=A0ABN9X7F4_9DINO|nr:unnamed protein product [Polarella glacialis]